MVQCLREDFHDRFLKAPIYFKTMSSDAVHLFSR